MSKETSHEAIFDRLRQLAPRVVFSIGWEVDQFEQWDGEGPDPKDEGMEAYVATVYAKTIVQGKLIEGSKALSSVYDFPDKKDRDIHGYLPQMLDEAAEDLGEEVVSADIPAEQADVLDAQLVQVRLYIELVMKRIYEEQRKDLDVLGKLDKLEGKDP